MDNVTTARKDAAPRTLLRTTPAKGGARPMLSRSPKSMASTC